MSDPPDNRKHAKIEISEEEDRKAFVGQYANTRQWPLEVGETVWIVKPGFRMPLGEFVIKKAHPNQHFELANKADGSPHTELVEGQYLTRDPFAPRC